MNGRNQISVATAGDARRAQIVHAAREICLEKGFSKITVSDIAGRVGMTRSLFYHYFQDKDQVADAVLDDVIDEVINDEGPFSQRMIADGNAELYIKFIDRAADRIAEYICASTVRDFERLHGMPIRNVHETFYTLIVGLISLIRLHPDTDDTVVRQVAAQTLHLDPYIE